MRIIDAISRKPNCIDCIHKSVCFRLDMRVDSDYAEKCGDFLTELPPVTQKSGKWINDKDDMPTCSECGYIPQYDRAIDDYEYSNYCPSCGAKMESEGEE